MTVRIRANVGVALTPPDPSQQVFVGQHPSGVGRELGKRPVFDVGQRDGTTVRNWTKRHRNWLLTLTGWTPFFVDRRPARHPASEQPSGEVAD